jgi:hypothetical protein
MTTYPHFVDNSAKIMVLHPCQKVKKDRCGKPINTYLIQQANDYSFGWSKRQRK